MALPEPREGATALITGASSGIGTEIARGLTARGHGVTLVARREDRLLELAGELAERHGVRAGAIACDLGDAEDRDRLAAEVEKLELEVDALVNNAGFGGAGEFAAVPREREIDMVRVNCEAVIDLSSRYLPAMVSRGGGAVINIASMAAFQPLPRNATYAATKAFVLSHSEAVHSELKGTGVSVTAVCPGPVRTEFATVAGMAAAEERTPGAIWMSAESVAEDAIRAAEKGKRAVVPGMLNQAGSLVGRFTPHTLSLPVVKRVWQRAE